MQLPEKFHRAASAGVAPVVIYLAALHEAAFGEVTMACLHAPVVYGFATDRNWIAGIGFIIIGVVKTTLYGDSAMWSMIWVAMGILLIGSYLYFRWDDSRRD